MAKNSSADDRRANAREKARQIAAAQAKKEKTAKTILYTGIAVVVVAVIAVVGTLVWQSSRPAPAPVGMVSGTVAFGPGEDGGLQAVQPQGEEDGADVSGLPTAAEAGAEDGAAVVKVYLDFQCPGCQAFEQTNAETLNRLAGEGSIVLEYEPVAILDRFSSGNEYSTRTANMVACVADSGPRRAPRAAPMRSSSPSPRARVSTSTRPSRSTTTRSPRCATASPPRASTATSSAARRTHWATRVCRAPRTSP
jgi:protein-disulfide isomerase